MGDGRVLKDGLKDLYSHGGLQLVDINKNILTQRLKWLGLYVNENYFGIMWQKIYWEILI